MTSRKTTSASQTMSKKEKVDHVVQLLPESVIVHKIMPKAQVNWAGVLSELDEEKVDGLLELLEKEDVTFVGGQSEDEWNESFEEKEDYIDKLEDLRISMEEISHNVSGDA